MLHNWYGNGKYTKVLCFGTGGGDARVLAPFHTFGLWRVSGVLSDALSHCGLGCVFHSGTGEIA